MNGQYWFPSEHKFIENGPDIFSSKRDVNIEKFLNCKGVGLLITHHRYIVKPVKVGQSL